MDEPAKTAARPDPEARAEVPAEAVKEAPAESKTDDVETPPAPAPQPPKTEEAKPPVPTIVRKPSRPVPEAKAPMRLPGQTASAAAIPPSHPADPRFDPQDVFLQSNPPGVTAVLDHRPDTACETPCMMLASPGPHLLSLTLAEYQTEIRQIKVQESRMDVPLITMHPNGGTLMISTDPEGANIFVDGRLHGSADARADSAARWQILYRDGGTQQHAQDQAGGCGQRQYGLRKAQAEPLAFYQ